MCINCLARTCTDLWARYWAAGNIAGFGLSRPEPTGRRILPVRLACRLVVPQFLLWRQAAVTAAVTTIWMAARMTVQIVRFRTPVSITMCGQTAGAPEALRLHQGTAE